MPENVITLVLTLMSLIAPINTVDEVDEPINTFCPTANLLTSLTVIVGEDVLATVSLVVLIVLVTSTFTDIDVSVEVGVLARV